MFTQPQGKIRIPLPFSGLEEEKEGKRRGLCYIGPSLLAILRWTKGKVCRGVSGEIEGWNEGNYVSSEGESQ